jgi:cytochrome c553
MKKLVLALMVAGATSLFAADGAGLYKKCIACHGAKAEKKALGKSQVIAGWDAAKIADALKGYKAGTYGGAMKGLMKGQVAAYSDADIDAVSAYISGLK